MREADYPRGASSAKDHHLEALMAEVKRLGDLIPAALEELS